MTTTNLTSDEREPTITTGGESLSVFEIMQRYRNDGSCEHVIEDALRRLSLLDNQAKGVSTDMAVLSGYESGLADAATRMREACVVHLQSTADALDVRQETECPTGTGFNSEAMLRRRIATELQSLTLDQVEQKQC